MAPSVIRAQSFIVTSDTVVTILGTTVFALDRIVNISSSDIDVVYHVDTTDAPPDWLGASVFGICDDSLCRYNTNDMQLWNDTTHMGNSFLSGALHPGDTGSIVISLDLTYALLGSHYFVLFLTTGTGSTGTMTFEFRKSTTGVQALNKQVSEAVLYPNPANNEVNVVYSETSDIKNIAVYNIIGKQMAVYSAGSISTNLDLVNMPSGIYFARLYNSAGNVVATRKFTKQ